MLLQPVELVDHHDWHEQTDGFPANPDDRGKVKLFEFLRVLEEDAGVQDHEHLGP